MVRVARAGLFAAGLAGAFVGGYFCKSYIASALAGEPPMAHQAPPTASAKPPSSVTTAGRSAPTRTMVATASPRPDVVVPPVPPAPPPKTIDVPDIQLPSAPPRPAPPPAGPEPVDPSDPAFQMIKRELSIKTTLDPAPPPPAVLTDAKAATNPTDDRLPPPPAPMDGPLPRMSPPPAPAGPDAATPVRLVNGRDLELDFEVTKAGLSKIVAVELWTTRDGGATWMRTDQMEGARSPFRTRLGSEGEYGFRLVFESESGLRSPEPRPAQPPDLFVELDTTRPQIQIFPAVPGAPGTVVLRWRTLDRHLDPAATRLEYSSDGRTWRPIELPAESAARSSHEWVLPPGVPSRILLRVTARDRAGNVATAVTNERMSVDLVVPEGKVTGARVPGPGPEVGPMPREVRTGPTESFLIPAVLRSALPALLNSPLLFPPFTCCAMPPVWVPWPGT